MHVKVPFYQCCDRFCGDAKHSQTRKGGGGGGVWDPRAAKQYVKIPFNRAKVKQKHYHNVKIKNNRE